MKQISISEHRVYKVELSEMMYGVSGDIPAAIKDFERPGVYYYVIINTGRASLYVGKTKGKLWRDRLRARYYAMRELDIPLEVVKDKTIEAFHVYRGKWDYPNGYTDEIIFLDGSDEEIANYEGLLYGAMSSYLRSINDIPNPPNIEMKDIPWRCTNEDIRQFNHEVKENTVVEVRESNGSTLFYYLLLKGTHYLHGEITRHLDVDRDGGRYWIITEQ